CAKDSRDCSTTYCYFPYFGLDSW
nr:immunoglobulin heavy chain junction region [Macaca mulatta]